MFVRKTALVFVPCTLSQKFLFCLVVLVRVYVVVFSVVFSGKSQVIVVAVVF